MEPNLTENEPTDVAAPAEKSAEATANEFAHKLAQSRADIEGQSESRRSKKSKRGRGKRGPDRSPRRPKAETSSAPAAAAATPEPEVAIDLGAIPDLSPFLQEPLILLSRIPAKKVQIAELALSPDEAKMIADSSIKFLHAWIPDTTKISPKAAAAIGLVTTVGVVVGNKYALYAAVMEQRYRAGQVSSPAPAATPSPETPPAAPESTADPSFPFGRTRV